MKLFKIKRKILYSIVVTTIPAFSIISCSNQNSVGEQKEDKINDFYYWNLKQIEDLKDKDNIDFIDLSREQSNNLFQNQTSKVIFFNEKEEKELDLNRFWSYRTKYEETQFDSKVLNITENKANYRFLSSEESIDSQIKNYDFALEIKLLNKKNLEKTSFWRSKKEEKENFLLVNLYRKVQSKIDYSLNYRLNNEKDKVDTAKEKPIVDFYKYYDLVASNVKFNSFDFDKTQKKTKISINFDKGQNLKYRNFNLLDQNDYFSIKTILIDMPNKNWSKTSQQKIKSFEPYHLVKDYILEKTIFNRLIQYSFIVPTNLTEKEFNSLKDINLIFNDNAGVY
ncbi:hypothetical protein ACR34G_03965 [Mycoplasma sp. 480]|uniref:hypothetical protein n=1 Tax=Mycoplasma sp. 480 TaxID=3440155 RepID=UPI003F519265